MGNHAPLRLFGVSWNYGWAPRILGMEGYSYIFKLYCFNAYFKYGYEYSYEYSISFSLEKEFPTLTNEQAVLDTTKKMFLPILYTVLTTICAFLSLIFSGIKPIIDFGWMMTLGLTVSIIVTFSLLPSLLSIFANNKDIDVKNSEKSKITNALSTFAKGKTELLYILQLF